MFRRQILRHLLAAFEGGVPGWGGRGASNSLILRLLVPLEFSLSPTIYRFYFKNTVKTCTRSV